MKAFWAFDKAAFAGGALRRGFGVAVLAGVVAVAFGRDAQLLSRIDFANTTSVEERLLGWTGADKAAATTEKAPTADAASFGSNPVERQSWVSTTAAGFGASPLIDVAFNETSSDRPGETRAPQAGPRATVAAATADLPVEGALPGFSGAWFWWFSGRSNVTTA